MVHDPCRGYCTSSAWRKAWPEEENKVSETCLTLEYSDLTTGIRLSNDSQVVTKDDVSTLLAAP